MRLSRAPAVAGRRKGIRPAMKRRSVAFDSSTRVAEIDAASTETKL
jgi:hypothetical protein